MPTKTDKRVAGEIYSQLGHHARCMIGAKNFACTDTLLGFRVGRNCKGVNYITIELNSLDLYDMKFSKVYGTKITTLAEHNNIYADMMHDIIESETGLRTSL